MAVESVYLRSRRSGVSSGVLGGREVWVVKCNHADDTCETARTADGVPQIGATFLSTTAKAISSQADEEGETGGSKFFIVAIEYSAKTTTAQLQDPNPLERPARYNYGGSTSEEDFFRDRTPTTPKHVVNSAGDPPEAFYKRLRHDGTITITRNVATFDDGERETYRCTTNEDAIEINGVTYAAGVLLCLNISASGPTIENDVEYWEETIELAKNKDGWDLKLEDRGFNELVSGKLRPILDESNKPVTKPYPLNGSGAKKSSPTDAPEILTFKRYDPEDWSGLELEDEE